MVKLGNHLARLVSDESGAVAIEYVLIATAMVMALIPGIYIFADAIEAMMYRIYDYFG
jgi:Flp pilus assembly pilin Flp